MVYLKIFLMPLLGGIIGYITNDIAIKMLFHPREAVYIGKWKVPFTPGLIPQQKERIARSIGNVVSEQLLNAQTVRGELLSEESLSAIKDKLTAYLGTFAENEDDVEKLVSSYIGEDTFVELTDSLQAKLEGIFMEKIVNFDIGFRIAEKCMESLKERLGDGLGAALFGGNIFNALQTALASVINDMIEQYAPDMIHDEITGYIESIRRQRVCDIYDKYKDQIEGFADKAVSLYQTVLDSNIEKILKEVDIGSIVRQKISTFDAEKLERLIFGIMKRELKAIVYLGGALGFLMGFINVLFL